MPEALCFLCFLSIVYLQTYPSVRYRGVLPAGVAYATPATASPCRRLSLRTSPSRPALRYYINLTSPLQIGNRHSQHKKYRDCYYFSLFAHTVTVLSCRVYYNTVYGNTSYLSIQLYLIIQRKDEVQRMQVYIDLENLLKEKNISKNKVCEACKLQRTQLNNYCKNKVSRIDLTILAKLCDFLECSPNDILKLK